MLFWCLDCYGDLCTGLSTGASGSSNCRSQVIRLVLKGSKAPVRSGDRFSYHALPFMEHLQSLQKAKGFTANGIIFFFICCRTKGQKRTRLAPGSARCWEGKKALHCCRASGAGCSTLLALPTQTPVSALAVWGGCTGAARSSLSPACSALGHFQLADLQGARRLVLHPTGDNAVHYNQVCSELVGFCSIAAARIDPMCREDKTCLPCLLLFGK